MYQNDPRRLIRVLIQIQQQFIILSLFIVPVLSSSYLFSLYTYLIKTRILLSAKKTLLCVLISLISCLVATALAGLLYGFLTITLRANQNVTGLTLTMFGTGIANFFGGAVLWDVIFGSLATLVGAFFSYKLKENRWLVPVPPIVANVIVVPLVLKYAYGISEVPLLLMMVYIFVGEFVSCFILGELLASVLIKNHFSFFKENDR